MILVITTKKDYTADFVLEKLNKRGILFKRLNCEDLIQIPYKFSAGLDSTFEVFGQATLTSVWFRRTQLATIINSDKYTTQAIINDVQALLRNLFCLFPHAKWLSDPVWVHRAENKLYQLRIAQKIGFSIPDTLVSNSHNEVDSFFFKHPTGIIIKPIHFSRIFEGDSTAIIYTNEVTKVELDELREFDLTPCIFQEKIAKRFEVRVTVVNDKVFAAKVDSQSELETRIDWRRKKLKFFPFTLPVDIEVKCIQLIREMNLYFGAIDLIVSPNLDYYFLE